MPVPKRNLVRIQEKGQVTLPAELRRKLGLKNGDLVSVEETEESILMTPQETIAMKALDRIGELLREKGLTQEEMVELGREIRGQMMQEKYGTSLDDRA